MAQATEVVFGRGGPTYGKIATFLAATRRHRKPRASPLANLCSRCGRSHGRDLVGVTILGAEHFNKAFRFVWMSLFDGKLTERAVILKVDGTCGYIYIENKWLKKERIFLVLRKISRRENFSQLRCVQNIVFALFCFTLSLNSLPPWVIVIVVDGVCHYGTLDPPTTRSHHR